MSQIFRKNSKCIKFTNVQMRWLERQFTPDQISYYLIVLQDKINDLICAGRLLPREFTIEVTVGEMAITTRLRHLGSAIFGTITVEISFAPKISPWQMRYRKIRNFVARFKLAIAILTGLVTLVGLGLDVMGYSKTVTSTLGFFVTFVGTLLFISSD